MQEQQALFISWAEQNGRTADLAQTLGVPAIYVSPANRKAPAILRYVHQFRETMAVLNRGAPKSLYVMLPPTPALVAVWYWSTRNDARFVGDLHTGFFNDPKWSWLLPLGLRLLRGGGAIVTNEALASITRRHRIPTVVSHDVIIDRSPVESLDRGGFVLCPLSYANDEPIEEILHAASLTPHIVWKLTGRPPESVRSVASSNVQFTGFVDEATFETLLSSAGVVLALTTRDHTMQRAGYEALMYGAPQVTSDFKLLSEFVGQAGLTVNPRNSRAIATAVSEVLDHRGEFAQRVRNVRSQRISQQGAALRQIAELAGISDWNGAVK